jgi:hypothetical protein
MFLGSTLHCVVVTFSLLGFLGTLSRIRTLVFFLSRSGVFLALAPVLLNFKHSDHTCQRLNFVEFVYVLRFCRAYATLLITINFLKRYHVKATRSPLSCFRFPALLLLCTAKLYSTSSTLCINSTVRLATIINDATNPS